MGSTKRSTEPHCCAMPGQAHFRRLPAWIFEGHSLDWVATPWKTNIASEHCGFKDVFPINHGGPWGMLAVSFREDTVPVWPCESWLLWRNHVSFNFLDWKHTMSSTRPGINGMRSTTATPPSDSRGGGRHMVNQLISAIRNLDESSEQRT